jgi:hypothetical protein
MESDLRAKEAPAGLDHRPSEQLPYGWNTQAQLGGQWGRLRENYAEGPLLLSSSTLQHVVHG